MNSFLVGLIASAAFAAGAVSPPGVNRSAVLVTDSPPPPPAIQGGSKTPVKPRAFMKVDDLVPHKQCMAHAGKCVCENGAIPYLFMGPKGVRYFQCIRAQCAEGKIQREVQSKGVRRKFACVDVGDAG